MRACICACMCAYVHACMRACVHTCTTYMHASVRIYVYCIHNYRGDDACGHLVHNINM